MFSSCDILNNHYEFDRPCEWWNLISFVNLATFLKGEILIKCVNCATSLLILAIPLNGEVLNNIGYKVIKMWPMFSEQ